MINLGPFTRAVNAAYQAFRESFVVSDPLDMRQYDTWNGFPARYARYSLHWAMRSNNLYREIYRMSTHYKSRYGLYRHTRGVYNPAARVVAFHQTHIMPGSLDTSAGDASERDTALPIETTEARLRPAVARLWWDSNWQVKKSLFTMWGTTFGDVGLRVRDDPIARTVSLEVVHPGTIKWVLPDSRGDVAAYQIERWVDDPRGFNLNVDRAARAVAQQVCYREVCERDGDELLYRTFLDNLPYDWNLKPDGYPVGTGSGARVEWRVPWPFVPFFLVKHIDIGAPWGESELELGRSKFDEVNDLGSKLHDHLRRVVEGAWLMAGVEDPNAKVVADAKKRNVPEVRRPAPSREEVQTFYTRDPLARPYSLIGTLDIPGTCAAIRQHLDSLEDDYPELRFERLRTGGQVSGEALRVARQPASTRIIERRTGYDYALVQGQMAALAIGGWLGYDGYDGFSLDSYSAAKPNHTIARRAVFQIEPRDRIAELFERYTAIKTGTEAGLPLALVMADAGYDPKAIALAEAAQQAEQDAAVAAVQQRLDGQRAIASNGKGSSPGPASVSSGSPTRGRGAL